MKDKIFLLSIEEAKKLPLECLKCGKWWWLCSLDDEIDTVKCVHNGGGIYNNGLYVGYDTGGVRPALRLDDADIGFTIIDNKLYYLGVEWIKISNYLNEPDDIYLAKEPIFYDKFDDKTNNYENSYIRIRLLEWYKNAKKEV